MAFEDMGIMRSIPEVRVIEPTDTVMIRAILPQIVDHYGVDYIRMARKKYIPFILKMPILQLALPISAEKVQI